MARPKKNTETTKIAIKKSLSLPGLSDIIAESSFGWDLLIKRFSKFAKTYGFHKIETPILEESSLYSSPDIAATITGRNFITFDTAGKNVAVRPSILPSVLRAYSQNKVYETSPLSKWVYSGLSVWLGAKNQFVNNYEFGLEVIGTFTHLTEAQVIGAVWQFVKSLGIGDLSLEINSIGTAQCQAVYQDSLRDFLKTKKYDLCDSCNDHIGVRPLNVFRCENLDCQTVISEAPTILDFIDDDSRTHFTNILEALEELQIPYQLNPLYAGTSGSSKTNCVLKYKNKGQTMIIGEAAYHESMMQSICGKNYCSFGFSGSLTVLKEVLELSKIEISREQKSEVFLVPLGELAAKKSLRLFRDLVTAQVVVYDHFGNAGVKNQLKAAEMNKSPIALIMGQKEAMDEMVILRDVKSGMQEMFSYDKIVDEVKKRLGR